MLEHLWNSGPVGILILRLLVCGNGKEKQTQRVTEQAGRFKRVSEARMAR